MDKMLRSKKWILLFLLPALLIFTATVFVPIIWSMVYSLYSWNGVSAMRFVGLENFADGLHGHIHHPLRCSAMAAATSSWVERGLQPVR